MKRLLIIFVFLPFLSNAQQMRQSAFISAPSYSLFIPASSEIRLVSKGVPLGGGFGYGIEYDLQKRLSLGISAEYSLIRGIIYTNCYCGHTLDRFIGFRGNITTHNVDLPVHLTFRVTKKENQSLYFKSGIGSSILLNAYRTVERQVEFMDRSPTERTEIERGNFQLVNKNNNIFGGFFLIAVGHSFRIKNLNLFSEILFRQDINAWDYQTIEIPNGPEQVPFKRQSFILKTGIFF